MLTSTQRAALAWTAIGLAAALVLWMLAPVLMPFVVAAVLAYVLEPGVSRLQRRLRLPRALAALAVELVALLAILALLLLMVPILSKELPLLRDQLPLLAERANTVLGPWLSQFGINVSLDVAGLKALLLKGLDANLEEWLAKALASARIGGSALLALVGNLVLIPAVLFYLLLDWPALVRRVLALIPPRLRAGTDAFLSECDQVLGQYLRGQVAVMLVLAAYYSIGLALFRFDLALPVGVFTGLAVFIPYVGFGLGLVLALVAGLLQFNAPYAVLAVAVVYGMGQLAESFVLTPRLVGERIGLNPLAVIFALLALGHLLGFIGVLLALPISALMLVALRRALAVYRGSPLFLG